MKPVIAITSDLIVGKKSRKPKFVIDSGYSDGIVAAGGLPIMAPAFERDEQIEEFVERVDGFLMVGGGDLNPKRLGKRPHPSIKQMHPRREEADRYLAKLIIQKQLPCLSVGSSMQLINSLMGGTLYSHLPEDMPRGIPHQDSMDPTHRHVVFITPATRLESYYGEGEIRVNSDHHQGVRTVGKGLRSAALAPDGLVEAYEALDPNWFLVGVQWHPESDSASALDTQLFKGFVHAVNEAATAVRPIVKFSTAKAA